MQIKLSETELNTYRHWLAIMGAVYFTLAVAIIGGVAYRVSHQGNYAAMEASRTAPSDITSIQ